MKKSVSLFIVLSLVLLPASLAAQHQFKFNDPVELVKAIKEPRGQSLGIAWSGSVYGIVYDDYWWNKTRTGCYFLIVDPNGKTVFGPKRLSKKQNGMDPKIVWAGNAFAVLHPAGVKKGDDTDYKYYLARYSEAGKKLSEYELDGAPATDNDPIYCKLVWTGADIGIFYYGGIEDRNIRNSHLFCRADSAGVPGRSIKIMQDFYANLDIIWDGKQYVFLGAQPYGTGKGKWTEVRILALDADGKITADAMYKDFIPIDFFQGVSLVQSHKKNRYLCTIGVVRTDSAPGATEAHWIDIYAALVRIRKGKITRFSPKNVTLGMSDSWSFQTVHRDGKKYYVTALLGVTGSSFAFARMNGKGRIISTPLELHLPRPACGCMPPYSAWDAKRKECGVAFIYEGLLFEIAKP